MTSIFYEKYKPQTVQDLVLPENLKNKLLGYVQDPNTLPNLGLFSSHPGTGKSSTGNALIKDINGEALWINASMDNGIDTLRGKIQRFATKTSFDDKIKIVVLDEFDHMSVQAQAAFRGFLDEYSTFCRFIFTGNFKEKIIDPMLDRLEVYDFNSFDKKEMIKPVFFRLEDILKKEGIQYDQKDLVPILNTYYPRIRSMVGALQKFSKDGVLRVNENELDDLDVFSKVMQYHSPDKFGTMIESVNELNAPDNMYSFLYNNVDKYFKVIPQAIVVIAKYQHMSASARDKNLNLAACLTELIQHKG
jgi:DNA polymerase III delta prime subunit